MGKRNLRRGGGKNWKEGTEFFTKDNERGETRQVVHSVRLCKRGRNTNCLRKNYERERCAGKGEGKMYVGKLQLLRAISFGLLLT